MIDKAGEEEPDVKLLHTALEHYLYYIGCGNVCKYRMGYSRQTVHYHPYAKVCCSIRIMAVTSAECLHPVNHRWMLLIAFFDVLSGCVRK